MADYMRGKFPFLGVAAADRRKATTRLLPREIDWDDVFALLDEPEREFHYVAADWTRRAQLTHDDLPHLKRVIETKSWWDTVDPVAKSVGRVARPGDMRAWATDGNLWVRRAAILHQLGRPADLDLLAELVDVNLGSDEFFIDKAIGWALRDAARHHPDEVRAFVDRTDLAPLSRREALKHLG